MEEGTIYALIILGGIPLIFILFHFFSYRMEHKCPKCKKITLDKVASEETNRSYSTKKVKEEVKDKKGQVIGTIEREVPTTTITYLCTYHCSNCGHSELRKKYDTIDGVK